MPPIHDLNPRIVEGLYCEALLLADELRCQIEQSSQDALPRKESKVGVAEKLSKIEELTSRIDQKTRAYSPEERVLLSCESLRATTRLMHCIAWLLNQRAYYAGEISLLQLRRHGGLIRSFPQAETEALSTFPARLRELIGESEALYARIVRLDHDWRVELLEDGGAFSARRAAAFNPGAAAPAIAEFASALPQASPVGALQAEIASKLKQR